MICWLKKSIKVFITKFQLGGKIEKNSCVSPIIHTTTHSIFEEIEDETNDGSLYMIFHSENINNYVYDNMNNMDDLMKNKKIKIYKYSLKKLDSLNWNVTYRGNYFD
jgi:hypothetical protein